MSVESLRLFDRSQSLTFVAGVPYVYHCHHYNLFHDQTIDDALGDAEGRAVRTRAARNAFRTLLENLARAEHASTPVEKVQLAREVFPWMGLGTLDLSTSEYGGSARGSTLHYGFSWKEKYGARVSRQLPVDAVTAGFAAAVTEVAYGLPAGAAWAEEEECIAAKAPECRFRIERRPLGGWEEPLATVVDTESALRAVAPPERGLDEDRIATIGAGLMDFMKGVRGDERGLVQAFSVFVAAQLSSYYNESMFEAVTRVEATSGAGPVAEELAREAGRVCVFNTFGNVLLSPEWEGLVGPLGSDPADIVSYCLAIARGLGFGHWYLHEYEPGVRFVMRASSSYEVPYYLARYGKADRPRGYFLGGSALAIVALAERVDWASRPVLDGEAYAKLFVGKRKLRVEQTQCQMRGDALSELVVTWS